MRRLFSTVYRLFLTAVSISALALSILTATSCDFLDFIHPYEADGRFLTVQDVLIRNLQNDTVVDIAPDDAGDTTTPTTVGIVNTDYLAQLADSISAAGNLTDGATIDESVNVDASDNSTTDELASAGVVQGLDNTSDSSTATKSTEVAVASTAATGDGSKGSAVNATTGKGDSSSKPSQISGTSGIPDDEMETSNKTSFTDDFLANIPANAYGLNKTDIPAVAMSGSAGLFCSANDVSIYDIWKGTFLDSEIAIDNESDHDESEDIARNGAVVSITFGALVTFILVIETIFGWKMCCEKWIVTMLAVCACVSQGVTFLFFNSERYCNANIIHEILEQDPCIPGMGGKYSIIALILYASIIIFVCCAPSADPYHLLCCFRAQKEKDRNNFSSLSSLELTENKSSDGVMGSGESSNVALSGRDHDGAPWMSEEQKEKDEDEII